MDGLSAGISTGADARLLRGSNAPGSVIAGRFPDLADKTKSLAGDRPDQALLFTAVTDRLRTALMWLVRVDSETMRPLQTLPASRPC